MHVAKRNCANVGETAALVRTPISLLPEETFAPAAAGAASFKPTSLRATRPPPRCTTRMTTSWPTKHPFLKETARCLDSRLEGNGVVGHVDAEHGRSFLDTSRLQRLGRDRVSSHARSRAAVNRSTASGGE